MAIWTEPKYPGDAVRKTMLQRGDDLGDVRIQHYGKSVMVGAYLPGRMTDFPGDTPKCEPDRSYWFVVPQDAADADRCFEAYEAQAREDGWVDYDRNNPGRNKMAGATTAAQPLPLPEISASLKPFISNHPLLGETFNYAYVVGYLEQTIKRAADRLNDQELRTTYEKIQHALEEWEAYRAALSKASGDPQ